MAHELHFTDGVADFFELGDHVTAWHGEGRALPVGTSFEDALAAGHLLYPVTKEPAYRKVGDQFIASELGGFTVRTDSAQELGLVGADYSVIQNVDAFGMVRPLIEAGALRLETGGVLRNGADAWVLAQVSLGAFPAELADRLRALAIAKYLLVRTNHSGRANASVTETDVRVVCANTLGMVERGDFRTQASVQHRGDATDRLTIAFDVVLRGIVQRTLDFVKRYDALRARFLTPAEWQADVMDVVARDPRTLVDFDPKGTRSDAVVARYEEKRALLLKLWHEGRGHVGDSSAWEAYNGVAEALDHNPGDLFPVRASRVRQLVPGGRLYAIKDAVFSSLLPEEAASERN